MPKIIVSDTSCLILFSKIGRLDILKSLFKEVTIISVVANEYGKPLPEFIKTENPNNIKYQHILESFLDKGEASAIALAFESDDSLLIIDEAKGRKESKKLGINYTGTLGIIVVAKEKGFINSAIELIQLIK